MLKSALRVALVFAGLTAFALAVGAVGGANTTAYVLGWGTPTLIESSTQSVSNPEVATDQAGNAVASWEQQGDIWASRYVVGSGWGSAVLLHVGGTSTYEPSLAMDPGGNATVAWYQYNPTSAYDIWAVRYDASSGWGTPVTLENISAYAYGARVSADGAGVATVVWQQYNTTYYVYDVVVARFNPGLGWTVPVAVDFGNGNSDSPMVAADTGGNATVVWRQYNNTIYRYELIANRYVAGSGWGSPTIISSTSYYPYSWRVAAGAKGNAVAVWYQYDGSRNSIYAAYYSPANGWSAANTIETSSTEDAYEPQVAMDPAGNAVAAWYQYGIPTSNIWANRYSVTSGWGAAVLVETDDRGYSYYPSVAASPGGNFTVVWQQSVGSNYNVWTNRYAAGSGWGKPERAETNASGNVDRPRVAADNTGNVTVVWRHYDGSRYNGWANLFDGISRIAGFELTTPQENVTVLRGERTIVPMFLQSLADPETTYNATPTLNVVSGPLNWSASITNAATGEVFTGEHLLPLESVNLTVAIDAPIWDPPGYGAVFFLFVVDLSHPSTNKTIGFNLTVQQGHKLSAFPPDSSAHALPGNDARLTFTFKNNGSLDETDLPLVLTIPPPPGWTASLNRTSFSAPPGGTADVALTVGIPANATTTESYCGRVRTESSRDSYTKASVGFCVGVDLVVAPWALPGHTDLEVLPGASVFSSWTIGNVGNAGSPVNCRLVAVSQLPAGWGLLGTPAVVPLKAGESANLTIGFASPAGALGGFEVDMTLRASCDGSNASIEATARVTVLAVHGVTWQGSGGATDLNSTLAALFSVSVENHGNVPESIRPLDFSIPQNWTVTWQLYVDGAPAAELPPFSSGVVWISIRAPTDALPISHRVSVGFSSTANETFTVAYSLRMPKTYGIKASFGPGEASVGPESTATITAVLKMVGNSADSYFLRVEIETTQVWSWTASYEPNPPEGSSTFFANIVSFEPGGSGRLIVSVTAPREPQPDPITVRLNLSSSNGPSASFAAMISVVLPDLSISIEQVPTGLADPVLNGSVTLRFVCSGDLSRATVFAALRLDGELVLVADVTDICRAGGGVREFPLNVTAGEHTLVASIDPTDTPGANILRGDVYEADEMNNRATRQFSIEAPPPAPPPPAPTEPVTSEPGGAPISSVALILGASAAGGLAIAGVLLMRRRRSEAGEQQDEAEEAPTTVSDRTVEAKVPASAPGPEPAAEAAPSAFVACPKCGEPIEGAWVACPNCGTDF